MAKNNKEVQTSSRQRVAALVMNTYSLKNVKEGEARFVKVLSEFVSKPDTDENTGQQKLDRKGQPAFLHLLHVVDLDTGEEGQMVTPAIMYSAFAESGMLTGRCFELLKGAVTTGKATKWQVYEIAAE